MQDQQPRIAIIGGGPSALFVIKQLIDAKLPYSIDIFERNGRLGAGMPYSNCGACPEHITNVSANEIPHLVTSIEDWVHSQPKEYLDRYGISRDFNEYKVLPRLFFGDYLAAQFDLLLERARSIGISINVHFNTSVADLTDTEEEDKTIVTIDSGEKLEFDQVIIATGHHWPRTHERFIPGYFDSPYPPSKLPQHTNHTVAIRGSSLTAIDAIRTLARSNGNYIEVDGKITGYELSSTSPHFKIDMYSRSGMLPAIRFHLEDSHLQQDTVWSEEELEQNRRENNGFLSLDYVFEKKFKELVRKSDPDFYERICDMQMEEFVMRVMSFREKQDPFLLFRKEYDQAEKSIQRQESIVWQEKLAVLSYAMNYPAKYFSAEDRIRLQEVLMPLIAIVIAFVPQGSAQELLVLHNAGLLEMNAVGHDSEVEGVETGGCMIHYKNDEDKDVSMAYETFIDCIGQPHLSYEQFLFKGLLKNETVAPALLQFNSPAAGAAYAEKHPDKTYKNKSGDYFLIVPGIAINDQFQVLDKNGRANKRIFIMAVPHIGGYNPDYSGLDFCHTAAEKIVETLGSINTK